MAIADDIVLYEMGELSDPDTIQLFAKLVKSGQAWSLQGHYGRIAKALIENGVLSPEGEVLIDLDELPPRTTG